WMTRHDDKFAREWLELVSDLRRILVPHVELAGVDEHAASGEEEERRVVLLGEVPVHRHFQDYAIERSLRNDFLVRTVRLQARANRLEDAKIAQAIAVTRPCERQAVKRSGKPHRQPEGPFAGLSEPRLDPERRCCRDLPLSTCEQQNHAQSESAAEHAWLHLPASLARADEVRSC